MNQRFTSVFNVPSAAVRSSNLSQTYGLLFFAMLMTIVGCYLGMTVALPLVASGWIFLLFFLELGLIWTAPIWSKSAPLNYVLFALFPLFSGLTLAPIIVSLLYGYVNGGAILANALIATTLLTASAAVLATLVRGNLFGMFGQFLFLSLIGLVIFGILQIFIPSLRTGEIEMIVSGIGIVVFSLFLAVDIQRVARSDNASPFLMALSLYLDIYNLFLFVLRLMMAFGGNRR